MTPHTGYGLNVDTPRDLLLILKYIFLKERLWHWGLDDVDRLGRRVSARALIDGNGAAIPGLKSDLMSLKGGYDVALGKITLRQFLILDLLASMYLEGLASKIGVWTTYPGSRGGQNPLLEPLLDTAAKLFKAKLVPDLLVRHKPVQASHRLRMANKPPDFSHQTNSMRATNDPRQINHVLGKMVVVFDDFITEGHASELGRNWLLQLGAAEVISVAIGKYGASYGIQTPGKPISDPSTPTVNLPFREAIVAQPENAGALAEFRSRYLGFRKES